MLLQIQITESTHGVNAFQWHERFCHDSEVMGSNPGQVKLGGVWSFCLLDKPQIYLSQSQP